MARLFVAKGRVASGGGCSGDGNGNGDGIGKDGCAEDGGGGDTRGVDYDDGVPCPKLVTWPLRIPHSHKSTQIRTYDGTHFKIHANAPQAPA